MENNPKGDALNHIEGGGVTSAMGFVAQGMHAGFRKNSSKNDLALIVSEDVCSAAGVFTQNVFCAAPVRFCKDQFQATSGNSSYGCVRAVVINSGNANAATGPEGMDVCAKEAAIVADAVGCAKDEVLVASTGVIGVQLPLAPFIDGVPKLAHNLSVEGGHNAALAIMTTDTVSKEAAVSFDASPFGFDGATFAVGGMAKGSGMIMPNMATMISVITTDAPVHPQDLYDILLDAANNSFNKITVDSDTSTNDTCIMLASGKAAQQGGYIEKDSPAYEMFSNAVRAVAVKLAKMMAKDGEGATKLVNVNVRGAKSSHDADAAARTIANSPLVKTAIAGHDANWGRIAAALGRSGASFNQEDVDIDILGIPVCRKGLALEFDEDAALAAFEGEEVDIDVDMHAGGFETTVWTCDLTHDYITINGDYRT